MILNSSQSLHFCVFIHLIFRFFTNDKDNALLYDDKVVSVPLITLKQSIQEFKKLETGEGAKKDYLINFFLMDFTEEEDGPKGLPPREIRERDIDYQRHRVAFFKKLLQRYPSSAREVRFLFFFLVLLINFNLFFLKRFYKKLV